MNIRTYQQIRKERERWESLEDWDGIKKETRKIPVKEEEIYDWFKMESSKFNWNEEKQEVILQMGYVNSEEQLKFFKWRAKVDQRMEHTKLMIDGSSFTLIEGLDRLLADKKAFLSGEKIQKYVGYTEGVYPSAVTLMMIILDDALQVKQTKLAKHIRINKCRIKEYSTRGQKKTLEWEINLGGKDFQGELIYDIRHFRIQLLFVGDGELMFQQTATEYFQEEFIELVTGIQEKLEKESILNKCLAITLLHHFQTTKEYQLRYGFNSEERNDFQLMIDDWIEIFEKL